MKKLFIALSICLLLPIFVQGQNDTIKTNSVFVELGGVGYHYSLNYDRNIPLKNNFGLTLGVGFAPWFYSYCDLSVYGFPMHLKGYYQLKKHTFECGAAMHPSFFYINRNSETYVEERGVSKPLISIFGQIGYKYSIIKNRAYIGVSLTPLLYNRVFLLNNWYGIKMGYRF